MQSDEKRGMSMNKYEDVMEQTNTMSETTDPDMAAVTDGQDEEQDDKAKYKNDKLFYSPEAKRRSMHIIRLRHFVNGSLANELAYNRLIERVRESSGTSLPSYALAGLLKQEPDESAIVEAYKSTGIYKSVCSDSLISRIEAKAYTYPAIIACDCFIAGLIEHRIEINGKCFETLKKSCIFENDADIVKYRDRAIKIYGGSRDVTKHNEPKSEYEDDVFEDAYADDIPDKKKSRNFPKYERHLMDVVSSTVSMYFDITLTGKDSIRWADWVEYLGSIRDAVEQDIIAQLWSDFGYVPTVFVSEIENAIKENIRDVAVSVHSAIMAHAYDIQHSMDYALVFYALCGIYDDVYPFRGDTVLTFEEVIDFALSLDTEFPNYLTCYKMSRETMKKMNNSGAIGQRACARAIMEAYHSNDGRYISWSKDMLIYLYQGFIGMLVKRYNRSGIAMYEELYNVACMSVLLKMESYDPEVSLPTTFFTNDVMHAVKAYQNKEKMRVSGSESANINRVKHARERLVQQGIPVTISAIMEEVNSESRKGKNATLSYEQVSMALTLIVRGNHVYIDDDTVSADHKDIEKDAYLYLEDSRTRQPEYAAERSFFIKVFEGKLHCLTELQQIAFMSSKGFEIRRGELICIKPLSYTDVMKMLRKRPEYSKVTTKDVTVACAEASLFFNTDPELQHWQAVSTGKVVEDDEPNKFFLNFEDEEASGLGIELFDADGEEEPIALQIPDSAIDATFTFI